MKWAGHVHGFVPASTIRDVKQRRLYHRSDPAANGPFAPGAGSSALSEDGGSTVSGMVSEVEDAVRTFHKHVHDVALRQLPGYLLLLVDVFRKIESSKNEHLKNAFMVIPALCVDFVDASLHAKDQVARAHKNPNREAYFTDDGFVMGVAAILAMLTQDTLFDTLKFFKGVAVYFEGGAASSVSPSPEEDDVESGGASASAGTGMEAVDRAAGLSKRRHRGAAREYELLMYGLSGARVFFKRVAEDHVGNNAPKDSSAAGGAAASASAGAGVTVMSPPPSAGPD